MTKELVKKLKTIDGYLSFSISTADGKIVGADIKNMKIEKREAANVLKEYNSIFTRCHKNAKILEIGAIDYMVFELENASLLMLASEEEENRLYFFTILAKNGNMNLAKNLVYNYIPSVTKDVWENHIKG